VARGDLSGTHSRETLRWARAGQRPARARLLESGQGMSGTLRVASEKHAYTLTDRATFEQFRSALQLTPLYEGGPALLNTYAIFLRPNLTGAAREAGAALVDWFADGEGRTFVTGFRANGQAMFRIWPVGISRSRPADLPDGR
jgi:tungstate transport system substrate-binding protein